MPKKGNGEGSFDVLPSGAVRLRTYIDGKRVTFTGRNKADCRKQRDDYIKDPQHKPPESGLTLRTWFSKYLPAYRKDGIKASSYYQLERLVDLIPENLLDKKINKIMPIDLSGFMNEFSKTHAKSYVDKMGSLLRSAFAEAHENDVINKNPARKLKTPQKRAKAKESYTFEEVSKIIDFAERYERTTKSDQLNRNARLIAIAVITLLVTGIRRGELLGIMPGDIDHVKGGINIQRGVYLEDGIPKVDDGFAKTEGSIAFVPAPDWLLDMIETIPKRGLYIFSAYTGRLMNPRNFNRAYDTFFKDLQKEYPEVRHLAPHCCRHTCGTLTLESGRNLREVQLILRHTNIQTTAQYTHPNTDQLKSANNDYVSKILKKENA